MKVFIALMGNYKLFLKKNSAKTKNMTEINQNDRTYKGREA